MMQEQGDGYQPRFQLIWDPPREDFAPPGRIVRCIGGIPVLYGVVFLSGAVLMSMEMIGSRLLAPTFGTSIYVWGSLITVVMAALTLGYFLGGRIADRRPGFAVMGGLLALAGVLVGFLPLWAVPVNRLLGGLGPRTGSLLAAVSFFFLPSVLLAMISPYGVKLAGRSLVTIGHTAGRMSAVSSAGSILGTLVTSFFLIPVMGIRNIAHTLGLILLVLAALVFCLARGRSAVPDDGRTAARRPTLRAFLLALVCLILAAVMVFFLGRKPPADNPHGSVDTKVLYARDTLYHHLVVDQVGEERHLHFDNSWQSAMYLDDPLLMAFQYTSYLHLGVVARPNPRRMLVIGLGGGSAPAKFLHDYPSLARLDAVEIDPEVVAAARRFFRLPDDPRLEVIVQDGRLFVADAARRVAAGLAEPYDLVVVDAYFADAIPYHLTTREFFASLRRILSPDGVVVSNVIGALAGERSGFFQAVRRTFADVFPQVYIFPVGYWSRDHGLDWERNLIVIATRTPAPWSKQTWHARAESLMASGAVKEDVAAFALDLVEDPILLNPRNLADVPLLTDDFAPVDTLQRPI